MGRPINPPDINKEQIITFRMTLEELDSLTAMTNRYGKSRSQLIREAVQAYVHYLEQARAR